MDAVFVWCTAVLLHAILCRFLQLNRIPLFLGCGVLVGGLWLAWRAFGAATAPGDLASGLLIYACLCELFTIAIAFTMASVSASLVCRCASGAGSLSDLEQHYSPRDMVRLRIRRLLEGGYAVPRGEDLELTATGHTVVRLFDACQGFFGHNAPRQHGTPAIPNQGE